MTGLKEIRAFVIPLPGVEEGPPVRAARRIAAFKVAGKSFLGLEKGEAAITVSLSEEQAEEVMAEFPQACEEDSRRERFLGLRVNLSKVPRRKVFDLIETSRRYTAGTRFART